MGKCLSMCSGKENVNTTTLSVQSRNSANLTSTSVREETDVYEPKQKKSLEKETVKSLDMPRSITLRPEFDEDKIRTMFEKYKDEGEEEAILVNGMERFCQDLGVNPAEFVVLVLAWKFNASKMCRFTRQEFTEGCKRLRIDSVNSIKHKLASLEQDVRSNNDEFRELYKFTFGFGVDADEGQRSLPVNMAIPLWKLVFGENAPEYMDRWYDYIEDRGVKVIPRDTWNMFLHMAESIKGDFSNYDESEAWPSLFDDFVESQRHIASNSTAVE